MGVPVDGSYDIIFTFFLLSHPFPTEFIGFVLETNV